MKRYTQFLCFPILRTLGVTLGILQRNDSLTYCPLLCFFPWLAKAVSKCLWRKQIPTLQCWLSKTICTERFSDTTCRLSTTSLNRFGFVHLKQISSKWLYCLFLPILYSWRKDEKELCCWYGNALRGGWTWWPTFFNESMQQHPHGVNKLEFGDPSNGFLLPQESQPNNPKHKNLSTWGKHNSPTATGKVKWEALMQQINTFQHLPLCICNYCGVLVSQSLATRTKESIQAYWSSAIHRIMIWAHKRRLDLKMLLAHICSRVVASSISAMGCTSQYIIQLT